MARRHLIALSIALHVGACLALYIASIWRLERLEPARAPLASLGIMEQRSSGGRPPAAARPAPQLVRKSTAKIVRVLVQPVTRPVEPAAVEQPATDTGLADGLDTGAALEDGTGSGTGTGSGEGDGDADGDDACPLGTCRGSGGSEPGQRKLVAPFILRSLRISGETQIQPNVDVTLAMTHAREHALEARFQICISETGAVLEATMITSTRYPSYDAQLRDAMLRWRYRPYTVDGRAIAVCGVVSFLYKLVGTPIPSR